MQTETTISNSGPLHSAQVINVIKVMVNRGAGIESDPIRIVTQYWSLEGQLLAETDLMPPKVTSSYSYEADEEPNKAGE